MTTRKKLTLTAFLLAIFCLAHAVNSSHTTSCPLCEYGYSIQIPFAIQRVQ